MSDADFNASIARANRVISQILNPATRPYSVLVRLGEGHYTVKTIWPGDSEPPTSNIEANGTTPLPAYTDGDEPQRAAWSPSDD